MKKRIISLLCVLALCLGLLPVTALAEGETAPQTLYVGGTQIIQSGYWTSSDGGTAWTHQSSEPLEGGYIHYDGNGTLTLHNVTITGTNSSSGSLGAGIYAVSSENSDVALTIKVEGTSTVSGVYGVYVQANQVSSSGGNSALLTISGDGTLTATGNSSYGIAVSGYTGGATLAIENVTVTASTSGGYAAGVCVQSGSIAPDSTSLSLAVNGGSLTASGGSGDSKGIWFYVGNASATGAAAKLTVGENAIVDAKTGGISATQDRSQIDTTISSTTDSNGGIVFDGTEGTVYGNVTLDESLTINQGETLTIPEGSKLDCNGNLTNNGTILVSGGSVSGNLSDNTQVTPPTINDQTTDQIVTAGYNATFAVATDSSNPSYQWQQSTDNGSSWKAISGAASATYNTGAAATSMNNYQYRCVVTNSSGVSVISNAATLTVTERPVDPPSISPEALNFGSACPGSTQPAAKTVTITNTNSQSLTLTQPASTSSFEVGTLSKTTLAAGETATFTVQPKVGLSMGTYSENITISSSAGATVTIPASFAVKHNLEKVAAKAPTCTEDGYSAFWTCDTCGKIFSDAEGKNETTPAEIVISAAGHSYKNGKCTVCGAIASDFEALITAGANAAWQKGAADGLSFTSNAAFAHFQKVQVDGKDLDASNYTVKEGSTIVALKASYLETLSVGKHTLAIVSETGTASTEFTIKAAAAVNDDIESPQTGDSSNLMLWIALMLVSGGALSGILIFTQRRFAKR